MTDILPRSDIVRGLQMSPEWRRFLEKAFRNANQTATIVTTVQQTVQTIVQTPAPNTQPHSTALDQLSTLTGPGFVEKLSGGYAARPLDYPDIPVDGAVAGDALIFDAVSGLWGPGPASASSAVIISDTPPASPRDGMLWADSSTGVLYLRYNDGTASMWVEFGTVGGGATGVPYEVADGTAYVVPSGTQALFTLPIELLGTATLDVSGYLVEVV
jgi:hypothetical protein